MFSMVLIGGIDIKDEARILGFPYLTGRWALMFLCILMYMCLGSVYAWSVFRKPIEEVFAVGATESGLPYMVFLASFAIVMPLAGALMDRYGPQKVAMLGGVVVGAGWIAAGYSTGITLLVLSYGLVGGAGVGLVYGCPIAVMTKWFPERKGFAVGLTLLGFGLSPFVTAPLSRILISLYGPFVSFKYLGMAFLVAIVLASIPLRFPRNAAMSVIRTGNKARTSLLDVDTRGMLRSPKFYALWVCFAFGTLSGLMAIGISSPVGEEVIRMTPEAAAIAVSVFAVFNGVGRPLFGDLADRFSPRKAAIVAYLVIIASSLCMAVAREGSTALYILSFSGFWLTLGGWLAIAPAATASFFGTTHYAKNYGVVYTAYGMGAVLGTVMSSSLRDFFGSYSYVFLPTAVMALTGMVIAALYLRTDADADFETSLQPLLVDD